MGQTAHPEITLRITVQHPPAGIALAVQRGRDELLEPTSRSARALVFELAVAVGATARGGTMTLRGPYVQGPSGAHFIYLNAGTRAGQADSPWNRRAKIPLEGITAAMIEAATRARACLATELAGTAPDGGPVYASLKGVAWRVSP